MADFDVGGNVRTWRGPLFKYKSLNGHGLEHAKEIIRDRVIYCPTADVLNDPLECKPTIIIGDIKDPTYWPQVERWARSCIAVRQPVPSEADIQTELQGLTQERLVEMVGEMTREYHEAVRRRYRILSFADKPTNHHLWMNYANAYQGVCFVFRFDVFFAAAYRVQYTDAVNAVDITDQDSFAYLIGTGLTKRTEWQVESECRLILADPPYGSDEPVLVDSKMFFGGQLTGIILGSRVAPDHRQELLSVMRPKDELSVGIAYGGAPFTHVHITPFST